MKTTSVYHGFALRHEELNKEIVQRVLKATPVERLYILGITTSQRRTEILFAVQSATRNEIIHYFLLAIVQKEYDHSLNILQDKIENNLQHFLPVTAIVLSDVQFTNWFLQANPFAVAIHERALLLYHKDDVPLPCPAIMNDEAVQKENEQLFTQTKIKIQEFLAGAELYTVGVQYKMAAFMLHQAAEQALRTMLIINTGLRINAHSTDKLVRYCTMFYHELPDLLPKNTEWDKRLFQLLQKAYIDSRYKENYSIKLEESNTLTAHGKKLFSVFQKTNEICRIQGKS